MQISPLDIIAIVAIVLVVIEAFNNKAITLTQVAVILLALIWLVA